MVYFSKWVFSSSNTTRYIV